MKVLALLIFIPFFGIGQSAEYYQSIQPPSEWGIFRYWMDKKQNVVGNWKISDSTISSSGAGDSGWHIAVIKYEKIDKAKPEYYNSYSDTLSIIWGCGRSTMSIDHQNHSCPTSYFK